MTEAAGTMTERVARLRKRSLEAKPCISTERAEMVTGFLSSQAGELSGPALRARVFAHLMEHKTVHIEEDELIVGEKGPGPKAVPTYPELCCHSLADLDVLDTRERIPYRVDGEAKRVYAEKLIPFWRGKTMREAIFGSMTPEWRAAYEAGVFTEFMEQRAPGHTVLDDKIYRKGMKDFGADIARAIAGLDHGRDHGAAAKEQELRAMATCVDAFVRFAERHAEAAREMAGRESNPARAAELRRIAGVCSWVSANAPRDFHEAIQYYWFVHLGVTTELNTWDAFCPGHLDRHLLPFYRRGIEDGTLTREGARELLQCLWVKFNNQPAPPKVGVTAEESGTYTDFAQINSGGICEDGSDGVNEVTWLILDVIGEMRLLQPSSSIQVSCVNPDEFVKRAARIIRTGFGQPSVFNADMIVEELVRMGKTEADARNGGSSGCVEVGAFGKESYILTGYFNMPKVLELALNNGVDPRTGRRLGPETGAPAGFGSFSALFSAYETQLRHFVGIKMQGNDVIERLYAERMPAPFLSVLIDDCVAKGTDYHDGGARYDTSYIQGVGLGTMSDALAAIRFHVFDRKNLGMEDMLALLASDFAGGEPARQMLLNRTPRYGNDDDYADDIMKAVFEAYFRAVDGRPNTRGGRYHVNLLPTTVHVYFGSVIGATPDGRRAGTPLSEGISPVQGADRHGPTAVMSSAAKMDHFRTGGTLLNQKLTPQLLADEDGLDKLVALIRGYFRLGGHHVQFNVVDAATLKDAQRTPEKHKSLLIRVAGYTAYFTTLSRELQDVIIARTEQAF